MYLNDHIVASHTLNIQQYIKQVFEEMETTPETEMNFQLPLYEHQEGFIEGNHIERHLA